jgi:predicted kinase
MAVGFNMLVLGMANVPAIVIILGSSASGKTTLGRQLAAELRIPVLCKDDIKEALFDCLGVGDRAWSLTLSRAAFAALTNLARAQIAAGISCIVEGNWRAEHRDGLLLLLNESGARLAQIVCRTEASEISRRFAGRRRHPGHLDAVLAGEIKPDAASATAFLDLPGPQFVYESYAQVSYPGIAAALSQWLGSDAPV